MRHLLQQFLVLAPTALGRFETTRNKIMKKLLLTLFACAAAVTALVNIEVNLRGSTDDTVRGDVASMAMVAEEVTARADRIVAAVREEISPETSA